MGSSGDCTQHIVLMGEYTKEYQYPNQAVQMPVQGNKGYVYEQKAIVEVKPKDKFQHIVNTIGDTIGWGWVFGFLVIGACVGLTVLLKRQIKKILGDYIKLLNNWINKE